MRKSIFVISLTIAAIIFGSGTSMQAQQASMSKKETLVQKFRQLTGANNVDLKVGFSTEEILGDLSAIVEKDAELTEAQKQELRGSVKASYAKVEKLGKDFFADQAQITKLIEEVIYKIYDDAFTEAELEELVVAYATPAHQKAVAFLPSLSATVKDAFVEAASTKFQKLLQPAIETETTQLKQTVKNVKATKTTN